MLFFQTFFFLNFIGFRSLLWLILGIIMSELDLSNLCLTFWKIFAKVSPDVVNVYTFRMRTNCHFFKIQTHFIRKMIIFNWNAQSIIYVWYKSIIHFCYNLIFTMNHLKNQIKPSITYLHSIQLNASCVMLAWTIVRNVWESKMFHKIWPDLAGFLLQFLSQSSQVRSPA